MTPPERTHTAWQHAGPVAALAFFVTATADDGATEHIAAWLLRALVAVLCVVFWPRRPLTVRYRDIVAPVMALAVVACGCAAAPNPGLAAQPLISVTLIVLLYLALLWSERDVADTVLAFAAAAGAVHAVWALAQVLLTGPTRGRGGFFNPNDLAAFLAPLCLLALSRGIETLRAAKVAARTKTNETEKTDENAQAKAHAKAHTKARGWAQLGAAALFIAGIGASGSRSGLIAVGVPLTLLALWRWRRVAAPVVLALALAAVLVPSLRDRWLGRGDAYAYSRWEIWQASVALGVAAQPFGVGLNGFADAMRQHGVPLTGLVRYPKVAEHAHNEVLHAWAELGWPGLAATLLPPAMLAVSIGRRWRQRRRTVAPRLPGADTHGELRGDNDAQIALRGDGLPQTGRCGDSDPRADFAVLLAFAIPALFSASLHVPPIALLAAVWAARATRADATPGARASVAWLGRRMIPAALGVAALVAAAPGAVSSALQSHARAVRAQGDNARALAAAELAATFTPWSQAAALQAARLALDAGQPVLEVAERLADLGDRFPESPQAPVAIATLLGQRASDAAEWRIAARFWEAAALRDPRNGRTWTELGLAQLASGAPTAAEAAFRRALAEEPNCAEALVQLARRARERGDTSEAESLARQAVTAADNARRYDGPAAQVLSLSPTSLTAARELAGRP